MTDAAQNLDKLLIEEMITPVDERIHALVTGILGQITPLAVLFYGSGLRSFDPDGLFDFYIIVDSFEEWPASWWMRVANQILPPNVFYAEREIEGAKLRAKIAVLTLAQFKKASSPRSTDTTMWTRFCQPTRLVWVRNSQAADEILSVVRCCVVTAAGWSARLQEGAHPPSDWWRALFSRTYRAELRVEKQGRGSVLMRGNEERYAQLIALAWAVGGIKSQYLDNGAIRPLLTQGQRQRAARRWERMAQVGRWKNVARLIKAAFTFDNGASYLAWKIHRHSGIQIKLTGFEEQHPLLCLPLLIWRARSVFFSALAGRR